MKFNHIVNLVLLVSGIGLTSLPGASQAGVMTKLIGDARAGIYGFKTGNRDGTETKDTDFRVRVRAGGHFGFTGKWTANLRFAGRYSDEQKKTGFSFTDQNDARVFGQSTLDMFNVAYTPSSKTRWVFGRMQTKFELAGVAKKSLDRNDSPNVDIDFTDGVYYRRKHDNGWATHAILQHNPEEGTTNVTRSPLDFSDGDTSVSVFVGVEKKSKTGRFIQRGFDISYYPEALVLNASNARDDYIGLVGRAAAQWPLKRGKKFILGGALGYAPNTPEKGKIKLPGSGGADGLAWQASFNIMNMKPGHSIGLVLAEADGGWLLSPDFRPNERLTEVRYRWDIAKKYRLEIRGRQRKEIEKQTTATQKRDSKDYYIRFTYKF